MRPADIALSRETQVLVGAVRWFVGAATEDELVELLRAGPDWEALLEQAEREGITGLVARALEGLAQRGHLVPALGRWHAATRAVAASNMSALSELAALRGMLRREGRRVILLKGAALLQDEYRGHVGLRPLGDIDLLVRPSDVRSVTGWLRSRGYEPVSPSSPFFSRGVVSFDLHTEIVGSDWGSAHHFRPTVDHDPVLIGWVNDFIRAKLISYFDGETRFLFDFSGGRFRDALERLNLATRQHPVAPLRVLISTSQ